MNEREVAGIAPQGSPRETRSEWTSAPSLDATAPAAPVASRGNPSHDQRPSRPPQPTAADSADAVHSLAALSAAAAQQSHAPAQRLAPVDGDSQDSTNSLESEKIFSPSASQSDASGPAEGNGHASSHDSQLLQLSQLAAAQDKMAAGPDAHANSVPARKRMADGEVKPSSRSPVRGGHSRNTSTVSVASNASTIGDVSSPLSLWFPFVPKTMPRTSRFADFGALVCAALERPQDPPLVCHGQGQLRLAISLYRRGRIHGISGRVAHL